MNNNRGFSLLEILIVIAIIAIVAAIAVPSFMAYYRNYKFKEHALSVEYLIKSAKVTAMERSKNIGLCIDGPNKTLRMINMGEQRSNMCLGTELNSIKIDESFVLLSGYGASFDPRGFAAIKGNACVSLESEKYLKASISRFGAIRIEKGSGGCP